MHPQPFGLRDALLALIVFGVAAAARGAYVFVCMENLQQPPPFQVQDEQNAITFLRGKTEKPTDRDILAQNIKDHNWFGGPAPFAGKDGEISAYDSPGYPSLIGYSARWIANFTGSGDNANADNATARAVLWTQCGLGAMTALFCMLFARLAFDSSVVGFLAGLLAALHPFWIVNVAEFQDGALASFLLVSCLFFGTATTQRGSPVAAMLFGAALAGLALTRAALMPFTFAACLWVLLGCRKQPNGWLCAVLAFLCFLAGLAPWTVRNFQVFREVVPISDGMFVHLWMGNCEKANGGPLDRADLDNTLDTNRLKALQAEKDQARRYRMLANDVWETMRDNPGPTLENRLRSGLCFVFGADWITAAKSTSSSGNNVRFARYAKSDDLPEWADTTIAIGLRGFLLGMLLLGLIGWRWSGKANLASVAMLWIPLPYLLSHAENLCGPRLPLDGVLLCFTAVVLGWIVPGGGRTDSHEE